MQYTRVVAGRRGGLHREPLRGREDPEHADPGLHVRQAEPAAHAVRRAAFGVIALCGVGREQELAHAGMQTCEACDGISPVIDDLARHVYRRPVLTQCLETHRARSACREIAPFGMERNVVIGGRIAVAVPVFVAPPVIRDVDRLAVERGIAGIAHEMRMARDFVVSAFEGHRKGNIACIYPVSFEDAEALRCRSLLAHRRLVHVVEIHIDITARMDRSMACGIDHMCTETDRVPGHVVGFVRMQVDLLLRIERKLATQTDCHAVRGWQCGIRLGGREQREQNGYGPNEMAEHKAGGVGLP